MSSANIASVTLDGKTYPSPGFGTMSLGNVYQKVSDEDAEAALAKAIEVGCTFWDTADAYGGGLNETRIGDFFKKTGTRDQVYLATKFGMEFDRSTGQWTGKIRGDPEYIRQCVKESTERLGTVPDLYYQHRQDHTVDVETTWQTLTELQKEGKLKALGVSEVSPATLRRILKVAKISALQIEYSPFERDLETNGLLELCREANITIVAYSPMGRGLSTGQFKSADDFKNDPRGMDAVLPRFSAANFDKNNALTLKLQEVAERKNATVAQISLAWVSAQGPDIIPIPGTGKAKNVEANFAARHVTLTDAELKEIRAIIEGHQTVGKRYGVAVEAAMLDKGMN